MPYTPTPEQNAIINHDLRNPARVLAGPGTGKSATLVALVDRVLTQQGSLRIKLLTFTRAATAELAKQVSSLSTAESERPSTIHSFSISVLLHNPGTSGFPEPLRIVDGWEEKSIVRPSLRDVSRFSLARLNRLITEMAANWQSLEESRDPRVLPEERSQFLGAWEQHRRIYGYTLLAELPYALRGALIDHPDLCALDYDALIVDEYQDLNACDLEVLKLLSNRGISIIGSGDDDQSIYSFRKAAPSGIRQFLSVYPSSADYTLSVSQRCGHRILEWANYVIAGDPDRPSMRALVQPASGAPVGNVAFLSFRGHMAEAEGVANIVQALVQKEEVAPSEIVVLMRSDYNRTFSSPIKEKIEARGISCFDPTAVTELLAESTNRRLIAVLRLLCHREDSLAWATLLNQENGIGQSFINYIYELARANNTTFAKGLLDAYFNGFPEALASRSGRARQFMNRALAWLEGHILPDPPNEGWCQWVTELDEDGFLPKPTQTLVRLLEELDQVVEEGCTLSRYLSQIEPLGRDLVQTQPNSVRIMTMTASKGLTVRAAILVALEDGIVPRPDADLSEERRILYVAMSRARDYLYGTWARRRRGPTARAGQATLRLRRPSHFLRSGPVPSEEGRDFLARRWG